MNNFSKFIDSNNEEVNKYFAGIRDNSTILWYPSSGLDFRDVIFFKKETLERFNVNIQEPEYIIHTDFNKDIIDSNNYGDKTSNITIVDKIDFNFRNVDYYINERNIVYIEQVAKTPTGSLLRLKFESDHIDTFVKNVIYLHFENMNFFDIFVINNNLKISHIFKNIEGCGFGGNRRSISFIYCFLGLMNTKYLLIDKEVLYEDLEFLKHSFPTGRIEKISENNNDVYINTNKSNTYYSYFKKKDNYPVKINKVHELHNIGFGLNYYSVEEDNETNIDKDLVAINTLKLIENGG